MTQPHHPDGPSLEQRVAVLESQGGEHSTGIAKLAQQMQAAIEKLSLDFRQALADESDARREDSLRSEAALEKQRTAHEAAMSKIVETMMAQLAGMIVRPLAQKAWEWFWFTALLGVLGWVALKLGVKIPGLNYK